MFRTSNLLKAID